MSSTHTYRVDYSARGPRAIGSFGVKTYEVTASSAKEALTMALERVEAEDLDAGGPVRVARKVGDAWVKVPWFPHDDRWRPPGAPGLREDLIGETPSPRWTWRRSRWKGRPMARQTGNGGVQDSLGPDRPSPTSGGLEGEKT